MPLSFQGSSSATATSGNASGGFGSDYSTTTNSTGGASWTGIVLIGLVLAAGVAVLWLLIGRK